MTVGSKQQASNPVI